MIFGDFGSPETHFGGPGAHFEHFFDFCDFGDVFRAKVLLHFEAEMHPVTHCLECCAFVVFLNARLF